MPPDAPSAIAADTLAERIARGRPDKPAISVREALSIARQIAAALEAAHGKGIVHRDLKPAHITLTPAGAVEVLDMGAKASAAIDKRTDIRAFGCVLYEMLTGRGAFGEEAPSDTMAATLDRAPDWRALPAATPSGIRRLLERCLDPDPSRRLHDIADARLEIDDELASPTAETIAVREAPYRRVTVSAIAFLAGLAVIALLAWARTRPSPRAPEPPSRFTISIPPSKPLNLVGSGRGLAISPDGRHLVYRAGGTMLFGSELMLRAIDQLEARPLADIHNAFGPFFSPDSQWIGFFWGDGEFRELKKVSIKSGLVITLCRIVGVPLGASWGDDDTIVFATSDPGTGLRQVSASGGEATVLTTPDASHGESSHVYPSVLTGGRGVLFTITTAGAQSQVAILGRKTGQRKTLVRGGTDAEYLESGHLIYAADGSLRVVGFDPVRLEVLGDPVPMVETVMMTTAGAAHYAVSRSGTLIYAPGGAGARQSLVWVDRKGREEPINAPARTYWLPRLSPDGTRVVVTVWEPDADLWIWELAHARWTRLTVDPANDVWPVWTPDGRRVIFASSRGGTSVYDLYSVAAGGTGTVERLTTGTHGRHPSSITPDGTHVVGWEFAPAGHGELFIAPVTHPSEAKTLFATPFSEFSPEVSPNGRYVAYQSNLSGANDVYVRPFPQVERGVWKVSTEGGMRFAWARSGRELFYLDGARTLMAVPVETSGPTFSAGRPAKVFDASMYSSLFPARNFDVSPDGQRFLMIKDGPDRDHLIVVEHWLEGLKARVSPGSQ